MDINSVMNIFPFGFGSDNSCELYLTVCFKATHINFIFFRYMDINLHLNSKYEMASVKKILAARGIFYFVKISRLSHFTTFLFMDIVI